MGGNQQAELLFPWRLCRGSHRDFPGWGVEMGRAAVPMAAVPGERCVSLTGISRGWGVGRGELLFLWWSWWGEGHSSCSHGGHGRGGPELCSCGSHAGVWGGAELLFLWSQCWGSHRDFPGYGWGMGRVAVPVAMLGSHRNF
ncbi:unnamed protein product [Lepidochelys kempii]